MMVAPTDEQAVERLGMGGGFFAFGIMHYYMTGMHTPGGPVCGSGISEDRADPSVVYGPGRGRSAALPRCVSFCAATKRAASTN